MFRRQKDAGFKDQLKKKRQVETITRKMELTVINPVWIFDQEVNKIQVFKWEKPVKYRLFIHQNQLNQPIIYI